jgi:hypothetical protein
MSYAAKYLQAHGQACVIKRTPEVQSYASLKRSTRATRDPGTRDAYWEGLILAESLLASGEVVEIGGTQYLVQSVDADPASGELAFFAAKVNASLTHQRYTETVDPNTGNIIQGWTTLNASLSAFGQVVTASLRQTDPGLLETTKYVFFVPKVAGVQVMDRLVLGGENLQVNAVDEIMLPGVARIQAGQDVRP